MLLLAFTGLAQAHEIEVDEGTFELGGHATANIVMDDFGSNVFLDLSPHGGYFLADQVELLGGMSMIIDEGSLNVGFFGGLDFFLTDEGVAPYLGATVGYGMAQFDLSPFGVYTSDVVTLAGRGGLVLPLNRKVGVDLGMRVNLNIDDGDSWLHIPLGYLGVRAFFP
jgi:hypothetical protein